MSSGVRLASGGLFSDKLITVSKQTFAGHLLPHPHTWRPSAFTSLNDQLRSLIASGTWPCSSRPAHHPMPDGSLLPFKQTRAPHDFTAVPARRAPAWKVLEHFWCRVRGEYWGKIRDAKGNVPKHSPGMWREGGKEDGSSTTGFPSLEIILKKFDLFFLNRSISSFLSFPHQLLS